jgi:hypothetical protein
MSGQYDFSREIATPEKLAQAQVNNDSYGFTATIYQSSTNPAPRQITDEELIAAGFDIEILKANTIAFDPFSFISYETGLMPRYLVPFDISGQFDFSRELATPEKLAQMQANNDSYGFTATTFSPSLMTPSQITDEELIAAGFDINILKANTINFDPHSFVSYETGLMPRYLVPFDMSGQFDFSRELATPEKLAQMQLNNDAYGFTSTVFTPTIFFHNQTRINDNVYDVLANMKIDDTNQY